MYTAPLEADYRSSTPAVSRGTSHSSDLFAELLRRHADVNEPAPQPEEEAARPASRSQRDRAPVEETDTTRAADADGAKSVAADADAAQHPIQEPAPTEGSDTAAAPAATDEPETATAEAPVSSGTAADAPAVVGSQPPVPAPTIVLVALAPTPVALAENAPLPAESPAPAPIAGMPAPAPAQAGTPSVEPAAPMPSAPLAADPQTAEPEAADAAILPRAAADAPTTSTETVPQRSGASIASPPAPAAAGAASHAQAATAGDQGAKTTDPMADAAREDVRLQVNRAAEATTAQAQGLAQGLAHGLGKLGTGAEVALAAQAAGDPQRPVIADTAKPSAAKPQPAAGTTGVTGANAPAQPMAATPSAAATGGQAAAAATPQGTPVAAGAAFDAALDAVTATDHDGTGVPSTAADTGLRTTGTTAGATHAASRAAPLAGSLAEQVSVQIQRAARDGTSRITVQLRPVELGAVEVRLDFGQDGRVSATILAERADTLDMLQRDARTLERSLQDAGLKADSGSLSFDLRDGSGNGPGSQQMASGGRETAPAPARPERPASADIASAQPMMTSTADGGVDIRV